MFEKLERIIREALKELPVSSAGGDFSLEHPDNLDHGDYSTNVALVFAKKCNIQPRDLAENVIAKLKEKQIQEIEKIEIAGPGFINFFLTKDFFEKNIEEIGVKGDHYGRGRLLQDKKVMIEYTDANPFKQLHIGHVMSNAIGESLSRIVEWSGAEVKRACYGGDVGLHVAKAIWGMKKFEKEQMEAKSVKDRAIFLGKAYTEGTTAYEDDETAKREIEKLNKIIFEKSNPNINKLHAWGKEASIAHFEELYEKLGTHFDFNFFESEVAFLGMFLVEEFLKKGVFEKSEGAIVFKGEKYGFHTRVFVSSQGLPTYEAKELGLNKRKKELYPFDLSIIVTANEIDEYFKVLLKAMEFVIPEVANKTRHVSHGFLRFKDGKMSSRKGTIITAESLIDDIESLVEEKIKEKRFDESLKAAVKETVAIGAIKYSILRQSPGSDIIFDFEKSISFEGDSGPYLQYAYVRAQSILKKAEEQKIPHLVVGLPSGWSPVVLEKMLYRFPEIVERAGREYAPHYITTYLTELAAIFNAFYAKEVIVSKDDPRSSYKIALTLAFSIVMKNGLYLLGIKVPEKM